MSMSQQRINISSGAPWEDRVGYSRAVRVGNVIEVTGTVGIKDGQVVGENDAYLQTKRSLEIIAETLEKAGASLQDVVRTRIFVTNISRWEEYGQAHQEVFGEIRPCTTMVEVSALISPEYLVEIEASAIVQG